MQGKKMKRITIKVGTRVLTDKNNLIDHKVIKLLSDQIADLMDRKIEVVLVSSGAIGAGLGLLSLKKEHKSLSCLQAVASIGQNHLMDLYNVRLKKRGYFSGQMLLTQEDLNDRKRFLNISYTINELFKLKGVPVINENDSVSTEEIKCGDNDRISSLVADVSDSDMLIILTDVDGLYGENSELIGRVEKITKKIMSFCKGKGCTESTGGMQTKLEAVKTAASAGIDTVVACGKKKNIILDIVDGKNVGTRFAANKTELKARKRWIAFSVKPKGKIVIDDGAFLALTKKAKSLLPSGIVSVKGRFAQGDLVDVMNLKNKLIAKGITGYASEEVERIKGNKTSEIEKKLGYKDYDEVIHRDNLVLVNDE